jgi:hypothetical protein
MTEHPVGARPWRVLAHHRLPGQDRLSATELDATGRSYHAGSDSLPDTDFDELVVGQWLHVEWMDADRWWVRIGDVAIWITVDPSGDARQVEIYPPRDPTADTIPPES